MNFTYRASPECLTIRQTSSSVPACLYVNGIRLILEQAKVVVIEREVQLRRSELVILTHLMRSPGRVFTRQEMLQWISDECGLKTTLTRSIDSHIRRMRNRLFPEELFRADPKLPHEIIKTFYGIGYTMQNLRAKNVLF